MGLVRLSSSSIDRLTTGTKKKIFVCVSIFIILLLSVLLIRQFLLPRGLTGKFYSSDSWEGFPALIKVNSKIHFQKLAISRLVAYSEKFSVIWEGFIYCPRDSEYFFSTVSDDGSWVYVDDVLIVDNGGRHGAVKKENHVFLSRGNHRIKIKYFDAGGLGVIEFRWRGTHFLAEYLPRLPLFPGPVAESRYRLDRFLTYAQILFLASLFLIGLWLLIIILRMLFTKTDVLSALAACLFFVLLFINGSEIYKNRSTAVNGCDTYAYLQGASLMSQKGIFRTWIEDPLIPLIYHGYKTPPSADVVMFLLSPHGHYVYDLDKGLVYNVFPPGVPWLLLPFLKTGGVSSAFYMLPLMNILFALLFFYLASKYVHILFGIGVSALTFFNLVVFENTTAIMSDLPSMVFLAACFFLLFLDLKSPRKLFLFLAGAFFGFSLAIRYSNLMGIIPVLFVLLLKFQKNRKWKASVLDLCCFSGAFLIFGVIPLALYTHRLFGTFFRLVYEPITQSKMQLANFPQGAVFYLNALHQNFGTVGILFIGLGLGGCLFLRKWRLVALTGILAFAAFFTFYSLQTIRHDRYLMPIYPFLAVFYAFSILLVGKLFKKTKLIPFLLAVLLAAYPLVYSQKKYYPADFTQEKITRLLKERVESDSAIFADLLTGPIRFYADLPGYRFIWTRLEILQETLQILYKLQRPVYFFLDSPVAEEHFQWVLDKKIIGKDDIEFLAEINGIPLYKYSPK